jgi:signal transduction histidine kinase/DNA-binding NarL/FixJ family response regulator
MPGESGAYVHSGRRHRDLRVLLVEDNPADARLIRELLSEVPDLAREIVHVDRLGGAREQLAVGDFDVVLLDLGLPDSTGLQGPRDLIAAAPGVPVLVLTGLDDAELALEAMRIGAQDYLPKHPLDPGLLARAIRYAIERERVQAADHFLAEAGRLLASSLDYERTLASVAELAVRSLADFCVVDIVEEDGTVRRLQVAHRHPGREELAKELLRFPLDRARSHLSALALRTHKLQRVAEVKPGDLEEMAQSEDHLRILQQLAPRSYLAVPLIAHERLMGVLLFVSSSRSYDLADAALAERLAWLAAMEVANARLYRSATEALRSRDRVLGVVAHDLRNPLSTIAMSAELLMEPGLTPEQQVRQLHVVRRSAERMDRLIQDLLDVARIESDRLYLHLEHRSPATLAREAVELNGALATARGLSMETDIAPDAGPVKVDRDRILQVLSNLIGNAIKFTPADGRIRVSLRPDEESVRFGVSDTGPGIEPEHLTQLFQPFWQARRGGSDGAGLGLAIAKGIVEAHGGRIWAESTPGRGTTFSFTLPLAQDRRQGPREGDAG